MHLSTYRLLELSLLVIALSSSSCADDVTGVLDASSKAALPGSDSAGLGDIPGAASNGDGLGGQLDFGRAIGEDTLGGKQDAEALGELRRLLAKRDSPRLQPDTPFPQGINPGETNVFTFGVSNEARSIPDTKEDLITSHGELRKRQASADVSRTVYITVNTCSQPSFVNPAYRLNPPRLTLSVFTGASSVDSTDPDSLGQLRFREPLVEGYAAYNITTSLDLQIAVQAPKEGPQDESWDFEVAASYEAPYHGFNETSPMLLIDSDPNAALLITQDLDSMTSPPWQDGDDLPFSVFLQNVNNTGINGMRRSYCALTQTAQIPGPDPDPGIESMQSHYNKGVQQQIYVPKLNASSRYYGILAKPRPSDENVPGGGGTIYATMNFTTKRFPNCRIIHSLDFCSTVAYAVPSNPNTYDPSDLSSLSSLAAIYDNSASQYWSNFNKSLQQIPCNTTESAQYSLAKTCDDCAAAYKQWLCAVTIPRCTDWTPDPQGSTMHLQPRNAGLDPEPAIPDLISAKTNLTLTHWAATNSSRNPSLINDQIKPGPYSEILPCLDLCHELVRACPAKLGFACPLEERVVGLNRSYARSFNTENGCLSCNEPGAVCGRNAGVGVRVGSWALMVVGLAVVWVSL